jgi:Mn2+/Fe2+ NRAMP family transporter
MSTDTTEARARAEAPASWRERLKVVGPGLVLAAAGVGAGDMISGLEAGSRYGTALIWAVIVGAFVKLTLTEGIGRWFMATGETIVKGWDHLGRWAVGFVLLYLIVLAFVYGAAVSSATALAVNAAFPILSVGVWAAIFAVIGFLIVVVGRYGFFERVMEGFVILMFITIVGTAIATLPNLGELFTGLVPSLPEGSFLYALGVMGGVGATIGVTFYGYWVREKGWSNPSWIPTMRLDTSVGYIATGIFVLAILVVGAQLLFGTGRTIGDEEGLVALSDPIGEQFGAITRWLFLLGFFSATFTSLVGGWNGFAYLFADLVRTLRGVPDTEAEPYLSEKGWYFRGFLVFITFAPMPLLFLGEPVFLVIIYTALGALFQPFLAATLLVLLNSRHAEREYRNGIVANAILVAILLLFAFLMIQEFIGILQGEA